MADVFLSYKRDDQARAKEIAEALEKHGYSVFFDAEIGVGEAWNNRIAKEMEQAKCVAVLWSERSTDTQVGEWVHNEARMGKQRGLLAPALIGDCTIPMEFSSVQAADLRAWRGDPSETEWQRFINRVGECVQRGPAKIRAMPWRRRWVRMAAALALVGAAGAGGAYYLSTLPPRPGDGAIASNPAGALGARMDEEIRIRFWSNVQDFIAHGECDELQAAFDRLAETFPGERAQIAVMAPDEVRRCRRQAAQSPPAQVAEQAPRTKGGEVAPPGPAAAPAEEEAREAPPTAAYLDTLLAQSRAPLTRADFEAVAAELGVEWEALAAVAEVETGAMGGYAPDGRLIILFEPHIFSRWTGHRYDESHPRVSYASWDAARYPRTQADRWAQVREAFALDQEAALQATSWGRFQLMGSNYATSDLDIYGYISMMAQSERGQLNAMVAYVRARGLVDELAAKDWAGFARGHWGAGYENFRGDARLAEAYARIKAAPHA